MFQRFFWIECAGPGRLAIVSRPAAEQLAEEVTAWRDAGVTVVASLLGPDEARELGLQAEAALCREHGIEFLSLPIPDRGIPASLGDALSLSRGLAERIKAGGTAGLHCHACIGRSGMIAAAVLVALGHSEHEALDAVSTGRGLRVPETSEQRGWVSAAGDALAERNRSR